MGIMRRKVGVGTLVLGLLLVVLVAVGCTAAENRLTTVAVFSLEACNGCTQTKLELEKIKTEYPNLKYVEYKIDEQSEQANRYAVKVHPTVLFLNQDQLEIGRIEETDRLRDDEREDRRTDAETAEASGAGGWKQGNSSRKRDSHLLSAGQEFRRISGAQTVLWRRKAR